MGVPGLGQYTQRSELWSRRSKRAAARLGGAAARAGQAWGLPVAVGTGGRARSAPGAARSEEDSRGDDGGSEPGATGRGGA